MIFQLGKILQDVRVCLDQNMKSDALIADEDIDTLSLDEIITSKVLEAVRRVHLEAPYHLLELGHNFGDALYWNESQHGFESGWVLLPLDFLRLVVFKMDEWETAVYNAISVTAPEYMRQHSRIKGIRGTVQRPICVVAMRPEGQVLEFYSCKSRNSQVSRAVYIPVPKIDDDGGVDISERCYTAVVYTAAGLTLATCGEADKATYLSQLAATFLK